VADVLRRQESAEETLWLASGRGIRLRRGVMDEVQFEEGGRRVRQPVRLVPLLADGSVDWDAAEEALAQDISRDGVGVLRQSLSPAGHVAATSS
jgi:hypothetical protein